jgi:hypothetical protein
MKLKLIALAVAALVSGGANATIDAGNTGNGNVLFTAWDSASSYTLNTGLNFTTFQSAITASTLGSDLYTSTTTTNAGGLGLASWLATAIASEVKWTIFATDMVAGYRTLTTSDTGATGPKMANDQVSALNTAGNLFIDQVFNVGPFAGTNVDAISAASSAAYTGNSGFAFGNPAYAANFNSNGSLANSTAATGLSVIRVDAATTAASGTSTYFQYNKTLSPVVAFIGADQAFHIASVAAVPEPESLAMLLAGMGVIGTMAVRRRRFSA